MKLNFNVQTQTTNNAKNEIKKKFKKVLYLSMIKMEGLAKLKAPVYLGDLKNRINIQPMQEGASTYTISDGVIYGIDLEYGNRPHNVPLGPLIDWVRIKGIKTGDDIYPFAKYVQKKIRTKGVNPQPFFRPAFDEVNYKWITHYKKLVFNN